MALHQHERPAKAESAIAVIGIERHCAAEMLLGSVGPLLGESELAEIERDVRIAGELLLRLFEPVARPFQIARLRLHHTELEHQLALPRQGLEHLGIGAARIIELPARRRLPCLLQKLFHAAHISRAPTAKESASSCNRASRRIAAAGAPSSSSTVASSLRKALRLMWAILSNTIAGWSTPAARIAAMKMLRGPCGTSRSPSRRCDRVIRSGSRVIRGMT